MLKALMNYGGGGKDLIINSFHMAGFFILSGMTFSVKRSAKDYLFHKAKSLLLPYISFALIFIAYLWLKQIAFHESDFSLSAGLLSILIPVSGRTTTTVYGLWFFPCLYLAEIMLYWIVKSSKRRAVFLAVIVIFISLIIYHLSMVVSIITILPIALCFMAVGHYGKQSIDVLRGSCQVALVSLAVFGGSLFINYYFHQYIFDLSSCTLGYWPLYIICGLSGSMFIYFCASYFSKNKFLNSLGRDSMYYYGLHYCLIGMVERIFSLSALGQTFIVIVALYPVIVLWHKIHNTNKL